MSAIKDLRGQRFGRLTAVEYVLCAPQRPRGRWRCLCDCGGEKLVRSDCLLAGTTRSCGCLSTDRAPRKTESGQPRVVRTAAQHVTRHAAIARRAAILGSGGNRAAARLMQVWS